MNVLLGILLVLLIVIAAIVIVHKVLHYNGNDDIEVELRIAKNRAFTIRKTKRNDK